MQRTMTRREVLALADGIDGALKRDEVRDYKLNYALVRSKHHLKPVVDEIRDMRRQLSQSARAELTPLWAKDPATGNAVPPEPGQNPDYDARAQELDGQLRSYLNEEVTVELHEVERKLFDGKRMTGVELEVFEQLAAEN